jgi:hypothetical protein
MAFSCASWKNATDHPVGDRANVNPADADATIQ